MNIWNYNDNFDRWRRRLIVSYIGGWVYHSFNSIAFYGPTSTLQLPFKGLTEEYMITNTREVMIFKKSKDPKLKTAGIEVRTGRRWNASFELQIADERLRHKPLVGRVAVGRTGLGYCTSKDIRRATNEEYRYHLKN